MSRVCVQHESAGASLVRLLRLPEVERGRNRLIAGVQEQESGLAMQPAGSGLRAVGEAVKPYYEHNGITIYHGDCREILPTLQPVNLVLTDPPYLHRHGMDGGGFPGGVRFYRAGSLDGLNDFDLSLYSKLLLSASPMLIAFHSRDLIQAYASLSHAEGLKYDLHVWHKTNAIPFTKNSWKSDIEYISSIWSRHPGWVQVQQKRHSKVWISASNRDSLHPTAKPIALLAKYILILDAATIVDPFMGSGTTLRAAKDLDRKAIGIETDERYCEIAANRLAQGCFEFN